jgi:hypothetical protein
MWPMKAPVPRPGPETERCCGPARHRHWPWAFPGICFAAFVAGWAGPLAAGPGGAPSATHRAPAIAASLLSRAVPGVQSADGTGTITIPPTVPTVVPASGTTTLTFIYTASANQNLKLGSIALAVPPGWTPPSAAGQGGIKVACVAPAGNCNVARATFFFAGQQVTVGNIILPAGQSLTITYSDATAQGSAGPATFRAFEQSTTTGSLIELHPSPVVTVTCADGTGTETVSPGTMTAASTSTLIFTYTPASGCEVVGGAVSLTVPPGWTPPSATPGAAGYVTTSPGSPAPAVSGSAITVTGITLAAGQAFTITYSNATAPGSTTTSTFATSEQTASTGRPAPLLAPPQVTVEPASTGSSSPATGTSSSSPTGTSSSSPATGGTIPVQPTGVGRTTGTPTGTMTVAPTTVTASRPGTLTFTYQPPASGLAFPGEVTLLVPPGWTPPSTAPGQAGYTTSTPGALSVSGRQITVTGLALGPGQALAITYRPTAAPGAAGPSAFDASERPGSANVLTDLTSSPSVTVAGPSPFHIPLQLLLVLLAAGCVAAVSAVRYLRHRTRPAPAASVEAMPQAGPPGTVSVQHTGTGATHAVSIEPHPDAAVTTIEETRP